MTNQQERGLLIVGATFGVLIANTVRYLLDTFRPDSAFGMSLFSGGIACLLLGWFAGYFIRRQ